MSIKKPVLWVLSKNIDKYKGALSCVGCGAATAASASNETDLFLSTVRGTEAAVFIHHHASFCNNMPPPPVVLLLDNDCANAGDIIEELFRHDASIRDRVSWIHTLSTGVDLFQFHRYREAIGSIPVSNARGVFANILAEHVVFSMLYFNRQVWKLQKNRAEMRFDRFPMIPLRGKVLGIVGYGNIAQACAAMAGGLGLQMMGLRRSVPDGWAAGYTDDRGVEIVAGQDGFDRIVRESDFLLNVLPATEQNRHVFHESIFNKMKPSSVYINIGRGMTQREDHLATALRDSVIRGAAVDVFEVEPLPTASPLWSLGDDKILLSPHNADITDSVYVDTANFFVDAARKFVASGLQQLPQYLVDIHGRGY